MVLPNFFRNTFERVLANFDSTELASGLGYVEFDAFSSIDNTTKDYHMLSKSVFSSTVETSGNTGSDESQFTIDFYSSVFNLPRTIKGDVIVNVPFGIGDPGSPTTEAYVNVSLYHVDVESSLTQIGSTQKSETIEAVVDTITKTECSVFEEITQKVKKGEGIMVRVEAVKTQGGSAGVTAVGHDPKNRDGEDILTAANGSDNTRLLINVPFKIDL